jgi:hypothetical protein
MTANSAPIEFLKMANGRVNSENYLEKHGIKPILAKVKHSQTNGKLEKWFDTYRRLDWILIRCMHFLIDTTIDLMEARSLIRLKLPIRRS